MPAAAGEKAGMAARIAGIFSTSGPGSGPVNVRPSSSPIWLAKMMTAMPDVKPMVTG